MIIGGTPREKNLLPFAGSCPLRRHGAQPCRLQQHCRFLSVCRVQYGLQFPDLLLRQRAAPDEGPLRVLPGQRLALLFTVDHKPGKLAQVIQIIGERGFNMETIKSRPLPHVQFEYYFYVQLICPEGSDPAGLIETLGAVCRTVRILGVFDL